MKCSFFIQNTCLMTILSVGSEYLWMRFEVLTLVKIMIVIFWVVTPRSQSEFSLINSPYISFVVIILVTDNEYI
jgi:hypothetical protein